MYFLFIFSPINIYDDISSIFQLLSYIFMYLFFILPFYFFLILSNLNNFSHYFNDKN